MGESHVTLAIELAFIFSVPFVSRCDLVRGGIGINHHAIGIGDVIAIDIA